jgi:hypothetical protein
MMNTTTHADLDPTNRCQHNHGGLRCTLHQGHKRSHYDSLKDRAFVTFTFEGVEVAAVQTHEDRPYPCWEMVPPAASLTPEQHEQAMDALMDYLADAGE